MTDQHTHEAPELRERIIGGVQPCEGANVIVSHIYQPDGAETCDHGHPSHDPGVVELYVEHGEDVVTVQMLPGAALMLANRLTRTVNLILESAEDVPDVEREAARFAAEQHGG